MSDQFFDEQEIRRTIAILKPNNQLFECRTLQGKNTYSGYFTDANTLIQQLRQINLRETNVYITLENVNRSCDSRIQHNCFRKNPQTTSDSDIDGYQWLLIDFDPERASGVSSSKEELAEAGKLAKTVYAYLRDKMGFEEPVKAISGNGYHLLYKINLANTKDNTELVHQCLSTLKTMFSNDMVKVDEVNYNPSRICKLHGTVAQKGANTDERPHRMSRILNPEIEPQVTNRATLEKLATALGEEAQPKQEYREVTRGESFDLDTFLAQHSIGYRILSNTGRDNSTIYALDECPFDPSHRNGDAKIFHYPDGRISFMCHHNSCAGKTWQQFRRHYDEHCYDHDRTELDDEFEKGWQQHNRLKEQRKAEQQEQPQGPMFRSALEIMDDDEPQHEFIKSGITQIDTLMHGLEKQCISVISGLRGCGKSTLIGNLILSAVQERHTVAVYSGELSNKKYMNWLWLQAAGPKHTETSVKYENAVGVSDDNKRRISAWMDGCFWLYNNRLGNSFPKIADCLETFLLQKHADLCIIDNMMALDLGETKSVDKYDAQTKFVWRLKDIAMKTNTHIIFVAHPKKSEGLIRLEDISGAGNISNIVDNAFLMHKHCNDFEKRLKEYDTRIYSDVMAMGGDNYIEIAKDREGGNQDVFIPLWFDRNTKRMSNSQDELINYGWIKEQEDENLDDIPF